MKILLISATKNEIPFFDPLDSNMDVLITGAGIASTLYHLQKRIHQIDYDLIVQAGIAGSFSNELQPGETVVVKLDTFGDLGIDEDQQFHSLFNKDLADKDAFPFSDGWLMNSSELINSLPCKKVKAITVNNVTNSVIINQNRVSVFNADIETMEGAALHYVCLQENIPFLQLRTISNQVGIRDKAQWNLSGSVANLNTALHKLFSQLNS